MANPADPDWSTLVRGADRAGTASRAREAAAGDAGRAIRWKVVAGLVLVAGALGIVGFRRAKASRDWPEAAYLSLRLFTLEGPVDEDLDWDLQLARFLAPLATASTGFAALLEVLARLHRIRLRRLSGHAVVCGAGTKGAHLAQDFLDEGRRVVVIDLDPAAPGAEALRAAGAVVVPGDATEPGVLARARAAQADVLLATCSDDATNAEIAVQAFRLVHEAERAGEIPAGHHLRTFAHVADPDLRTLFRRQDVLNDPKDAFELRLFNLYENSARLLMVDGLSRSLVRRRGRDAPAHLVVVGFGPAGEAVLVEAVRMPHRAADGSLRVTMVDGDGERKRDTLRRRHPGIEAVCRLHVETTRIDDAGHLDHLVATLDAEEPVSALVLCLEDRKFSVACVLAVLPRCSAAGIPVFVRLPDERGLATLLQAGTLGSQREGGLVRAFGAADVAGGTEAVLDEALDRVARRIHESYVAGERSRGTTAEANPAMVEWPVLPETLRDSNRRQADHIPFKLHAVGRWAASADDPQRADAPLTDEEVERLAALEHARWNAERRLEGWTHAPGKKDVARRTSPHLVDYADLPDDVRQYDRDAVRLIPGILAARGLRIVRAGTPPEA